MARVFVATERALGRRVVIKVLSPELAAEVSSRRFEREIKLAASLQQANIVPVLSAGVTDGLPHYTMPFVEGLSLRERLTRAKPGLAETISILRDVARALAYAHEHGVVHRDIKPENVLLSGDAAVVTDFGIAKAIASSRLTPSDAHSAEITMAGTAVGTPAYMAPEQITMDPSIDHRADLYSFGCLAYELLNGEPPFAMRSLHELFAAHIADRPRPVAERSPDTPPDLAAMVMRCLEKNPALRPQSAREILATLEGGTARASGITLITQRLTKRQRRVLAASFAVAVVALAMLLLRGAGGTRAPALATVAVIPFLNVGGDTTSEYLADGIADGLATALGKVPGVRMVARTSAYRYKGRRDIDAAVIGKSLSANHVLHGTVQRAGDALRVSAQLLDARNNQELWSDVYNRRAVDAFVVQDEIARQIAGALSRRIGTPAATFPATATSGTSNPEAYDLYLRGRFLLRRRGPGVKQSIEKFEQAIAKDSALARAHAGLALALELLPYFETVDARAQGERSIPAARRALALDSTAAEAHIALALAHQHAWQWALAEADLRRAVALGPDEVDAHIQYGRFLFEVGRFVEAQREFERAREVDPYSAVASGWVGHLLSLSGRNDEALIELRRAMEIDSTSPPALFMTIQAYAVAGRMAEARAFANRLYRQVPTWRAAAVAVLATVGDTAPARELIRRMESAGVKGGPGQQYVYGTMAYFAIGDTARALDALERATDAHENWPTTYSISEPAFDPIRQSPRFAAVVRRVGLDERIFTSPTGGRPR